MPVPVSSEIADGTAQDKRADSLFQAWGKIDNRLAFFVAQWDIVFRIINFPDKIRDLPLSWNLSLRELAEEILIAVDS